MDNVERFIEHVKEECKRYGIKLVLRDVKYLQASRKVRCGGYFDEEAGVLAVATKSERWFEILVHEYCHLTQWRDNCEVWQGINKSIVKVNDWLEGKNVRGIKQALAHVRDMELDNEKRSVRTIKKWDLPVDIKLYTQKANSYVLFYNWMYYTRRWCSVKNSPYRNPAIYSRMPTTFRINHSVLLPRYYKIFKEVGV